MQKLNTRGLMKKKINISVYNTFNNLCKNKLYHRTKGDTVFVYADLTKLRFNFLRKKIKM